MSPRLARIVGIVALLSYPSFLIGAERAAPETTPAGKTPRVHEGAVRTALELLGAEARFASDADVLTPAGDGALERLVARLEHHGELLSIRVVGHTDDRGSAEHNLRLSARRAAYVSAFVARRHPDVPLSSAGAGESAPLASNATPAGRARNRRVEIHIVAAIRARD